jgi:hypothetical protein
MNRRLRGVLGTALTWSVGWGILGLVEAALRSLPYKGVRIPIDPMRFVITVTLNRAIFGFVSGALFALALWYVGRRARGLGALSTRRVAAWGMVAGSVLPAGVVALLTATGVAIPLPPLLMMIATGGLFGAGTAAGTVAIARRAPEPLAVGSAATALAPPGA